VARDAEAQLGCQMQPLYGATDGGVPVMTRLSDPPEKRHTTAGRLVPHTVLRLVDADGNDVEADSAGEVLWRNPIKSLGYLNDPERTASAFTEDGLYRSGDLGRIDAEGYLRIVGRVKDVIIRGGQNISPRELEDLLTTMPSVSEVAVIGVPDATYGEVVCACVISPPHRTAKLPDMVAHLNAADVAEFKLPTLVEIFEDFPRNTGGKVSKPDLRTAVLERIAAHPEDGTSTTAATG
jgi:non-ribosomal peptide synthetase component E (peptide arylation enzyme)